MKVFAAMEGDWLDRIARTAGLGSEDLDRWIWGGLLVGLILSVLHLLTMMATRWGEHHRSAKAMIFSVMAHVLALLTWGVVVPQSRPSQETEREDPQQIVEFQLPSEERVDLRDSGNTPVWEKLPEPVKPALSRIDRELEDPIALNTPDRSQEMPSPTAPEDVPDPLDMTREPIATPKLYQAGVAEPVSDQAEPVEVPLPELADRPQPVQPQPSRDREPVLRQDEIEPTVSREVAPGAAERVAPDVNPIRELAWLPSPADPDAFLQRATPADAPTTRAAPAPAEAPAETPGSVAERTSDGSSAGSPLAFQPTRSRAASEQQELTPTEPVREMQLRSGTQVPVPDQLAALTPTPAGREATATPSLVRPAESGAVRRPEEAAVPTIYRSRDQERRQDIAMKSGGTKQSEAAVDLALRWLARSQHPDGYWDADAHGAGQVRFDQEGNDRQNAGRSADSGVTALALLTFLGAGHTGEKGEHAATVERGLRWLVSQQRADGFLAAGAAHYEQMYCHGMATYALAEAYGMQENRGAGLRLRDPLERAVDFLLAAQNDDGGWRYSPTDPKETSDMSMFGWQVMALKRAQLAGIRVPPEAEDRMIQFLVRRSQGEEGGLAAYWGRQDDSGKWIGAEPKVTPSMTAEAWYCKQRLGIRHDNPQAVEAARYLLQHPPRLAEMNLYYWYYGTLAMHDHGAVAAPQAGTEQTGAAAARRRQWESWNQSLREILVETQLRESDEAGSWEPNDVWGPYGGRVYSTALAAMCLEVYYRAGTGP